MSRFNEPVPTYRDYGMSRSFTKPMTLASTRFSQIEATQRGGMTGLNFDQLQTSGSLGDTFQVGNILIDGSGGRLAIENEEQIQLLIGRDYE